MKPNFKQLQKVWYDKLKKSGFLDIEDKYERLVEHHSSKYSSINELSFNNKQRYYEIAGQVLHDHKFKSSEEREIWRLHSEGRSIRTISKKVGRGTGYVQDLIHQLAELWIKL